MAALTGITLVKEFTYRDNPIEQFSSKYHFRDLPPGDDASWQVFATDLINLERQCNYTDVSYVAAYGYNDDSPTAQSVWSYDYKTPGPPPTGNLGHIGSHMSGDQAAMIWWRTAKKNSRGKWIYLRKYMHGGDIELTNKDELDGSYFSALKVFVNALWMPPTPFHGGIRARAFADPVTAGDVSTWVTTRTLRRRGKRPLARA